jgi:TRAP-type C4-dicarboxylate transport system permease small subunit
VALGQLIAAPGQLHRYMPSSSQRWLKWLGNCLIAISALFFLETSFEMYFLTLTQGPQMLGFSLIHIAPLAVVILVFMSAISFLLLAAFALIVQIVRLAGGLKSASHYSRFLLLVLCVQLIHGLLLLTYDRWSLAFAR